MSPESLIISESGAPLWLIRIHQRFFGGGVLKSPVLCSLLIEEQVGLGTWWFWPLGSDGSRDGPGSASFQNRPHVMRCVCSPLHPSVLLYRRGNRGSGAESSGPPGGLSPLTSEGVNPGRLTLKPTLVAGCFHG